MLCHICPHKIMSTNHDGDLIYTEKAMEIISNSEDPYNDLPCKDCTLKFSAGMEYKKGCSHISTDAIGAEATHYDEQHPLYNQTIPKTPAEAAQGNLKPDVILLPLETLLHVQGILRSLKPDQRSLIEYKLTFPLDSIAQAARFLKIETTRAYNLINAVKKNNPIIRYMLNREDYKSIDIALKEQKEIDKEKYSRIEKDLSKYSSEVSDKIRHIAHFLDLSRDEIKEYVKILKGN